jgi:hypothetical protein
MQADSTDNLNKTYRFPCAQRGASLRYAPGIELLRCAYCGHENASRLPEPYRAEYLSGFCSAMYQNRWPKCKPESGIRKAGGAPSSGLTNPARIHH